MFLPNSIDLLLVHISKIFCQHAGIEKSFNPFKSIKLTDESPETTNEDFEPKVKAKGLLPEAEVCFCSLHISWDIADLSELLQHRFLSYPLG